MTTLATVLGFFAVAFVLGLLIWKLATAHAESDAAKTDAERFEDWQDGF